MKFKKRIYIYIAVLIAFGLVGFILYQMFESGDTYNSDSDVAPLSCLNAVPADALAIYGFENLRSASKVFSVRESLSAEYLPVNGSLKELLEYIATDDSLDSIAKAPASISFHYSGRNDISPLLAISVTSGERLLKGLVSRYKDFRKVEYGDTHIYRNQTLNMAFFKEYLLISTSIIVLESSLRHIETNSSILDRSDFKQIISHSKIGSNMLFIDHSQFGKIFAGLIDRAYYSYVGFFTRIASWSILRGEQDGRDYIYEGKFVNNRGGQEFCSVLNGMSCEKSEVYDILPLNTVAVMAITVGDFSLFAKRYAEYKRANVISHADVSDEGCKWFDALTPKEVAIAVIPFKGENHFVSFIRCANRLSSQKDAIKIEEFRHGGFLSGSFGDIFSNTTEEAICYRDNWAIIGESDVIREFIVKDGTAIVLGRDFSVEKSILSVLYNTAGKAVRLQLFPTGKQGKDFDITLYGTKSNKGKEGKESLVTGDVGLK